MKKTAVVILMVLFAFSVYAGSRPKKELTETVKNKEPEAVSLSSVQADKKEAVKAESKVKVTFIELGSVKCVPCKMMVPVMEEIEKKYGKEVKVVFHDVWTPAGEPYARQYSIRGIPTQIFLDENGKEFHRHIGFYPLEQILPVLKQAGVKVD